MLKANFMHPNWKHKIVPFWVSQFGLCVQMFLFLYKKKYSLAISGIIFIIS